MAKVLILNTGNSTNVRRISQAVIVAGLHDVEIVTPKESLDIPCPTIHALFEHRPDITYLYDLCNDQQSSGRNFDGTLKRR